MVARCGHTGYDRGENRVERLVHFSQAVGGPDDSAVNTDRCQRHTGRASNEVAQQDEIQPGDQRVNELINADGSRIREQ